jgi:catechol 2,3-dioxygenase-like lactoylglutathione lyase family enzyme
MRLRQVALAALDLDRTVEALCDVLGVEVAFHDPGVAVFGLRNAVMPVGETFLEVVSPVREDATAKRWIDKRGGDAGYMVIAQLEADALDREVARAERAGAVQVWTGEHAGARTVHFHPRELGAILSFDAMPEWESWVWAGPAWRDHVRRGTSTAITGALLESGDPGKLAVRWGEVLGIAPRPDARGRPEIALPRGGRLVFVPGDGAAGLAGVEVALADHGGFAARARARGVLGGDGAAAIAGVRFVPA